jgi:hypothetical protein
MLTADERIAAGKVVKHPDATSTAPGTFVLPWTPPELVVFGDHPEPPRGRCWVDGGLVQERMLTMLAAPPKAGKTFALLDLAAALASGSNWLGFAITEKARVLVVDLETDPHYLFRRIERLKKSHPDIGERLAILPWRHATIEPGFNPERACGRIEQMAEQHQADVVLIDSVYLMLDGDESDPVAVGALCKAMARLTKRRAVVYSHHFTKGSATAHRTKAAMDRASGSSWWSRFCDAIITLTPGEEATEADSPPLLEAEFLVRHHPPVVPKWVQRSAETFRFSAAAADAVAAQQKQEAPPTPGERRRQTEARDVWAEIVSVMETQYPTGVLKTDLRALCDKTKVATGGTFTRALKGLLNARRLVLRQFADRRGMWVFLPQTAPPLAEGTLEPDDELTTE